MIHADAPGRLDRNELMRLLRASPIAGSPSRIDDQPYALPVNLASDEYGRVVFRTNDHSRLI